MIFAENSPKGVDKSQLKGLSILHPAPACWVAPTKTETLGVQPVSPGAEILSGLPAANNEAHCKARGGPGSESQVAAQQVAMLTWFGLPSPTLLYF